MGGREIEFQLNIWISTLYTPAVEDVAVCDTAVWDVVAGAEEGENNLLLGVDLEVVWEAGHLQPADWTLRHSHGG